MKQLTNLDFVGKSRALGLQIPLDLAEAATKGYVDSKIVGLDRKPAVRLATTANLVGTYDNGLADDGVGATLTASVNGKLTLDTKDAALTDRILVKDQIDQTHNGVYVVSATGGVSAKWTLTRATDFDNNPNGEINYGSLVFVIDGSVNKHSGWTQDTPDPVVLGPTGSASAIVFGQFTGAADLIAGNGISIVGNTISVMRSEEYTSPSYSGLDSTVGLKIALQATSGMILEASGVRVVANNGLNVDATANAVQLGGSLAKATTITRATYALNLGVSTENNIAISDTTIKSTIKGATYDSTFALTDGEIKGQIGSGTIFDLTPNTLGITLGTTILGVSQSAGYSFAQGVSGLGNDWSTYTQTGTTITLTVNNNTASVVTTNAITITDVSTTLTKAALYSSDLSAVFTGNVRAIPDAGWVASQISAAAYSGSTSINIAAHVVSVITPANSGISKEATGLKVINGGAALADATHTVTLKYAETINLTEDVAYTVTHGLGTSDITVQAYYLGSLVQLSVSPTVGNETTKVDIQATQTISGVRVVVVG